LQNFIRSFKDTPIRMIRRGQEVYYSAFDIATSLEKKNKRRAVTMAVIKGHGKFLERYPWEDEEILFINSDYAIALAIDSDYELAIKFIKWIIEVEKVSCHFEDKINETTKYFAITQIAKKYGISAIKLNDILLNNRIQYKVNDQWVLYSKYQGMGLYSYN
jgi:hypothetical protein